MSDEVLEISFDELEELFNEAEQLLEQATSFANIGKFHSYATTHIWTANPRQTVQVSAQEWRKHKPVRGKSSKFISLHVCLDLQEFDPANTFEYDKYLMAEGGSSWVDVNGDGVKEEFESDWEATWKPSVKETLGKQYENMSQAIKYLEGKYVKILNVKQQPTKKNPEPADNHTTPKLVEIYPSREAAYQDYQTITGNSEPIGETTTSESKPGPTSDYETWDEFAGNVRTMREQGTTDKEISEMLEVKIKDVLKVK